MANFETFYCVRVYADLSAKHTRRDREGMESWLNHNSTYRPGCALFVDGRLANPAMIGVLTSDEVGAIEAALGREMTSGTAAKVPLDAFGPQFETYCGRREAYQGYPADVDRNGFEELIEVSAPAL